MIGVAFGLALIGFVYVLFWSIRNDGVETLGEQKGLLRMKVPMHQENGDQ